MTITTKVVPPALPSAVSTYDAEAQGDYTSILRLYFQRLSNLLDLIITNINTLVGSALPPGGTANQHLTKIDSTDYNAEWTDLTFARPTVTTQTVTTYTIDADDEYSLILFTNVSGCLVTLPSDTAENFPIGYIVHLHQDAVGQVVAMADTGVTILWAVGYTTRTQNSSLSIIKQAADTYKIIGDAELASDSNVYVPPAAAALTLTGYVPTVDVVLDTGVVPAVGSLAITGIVPTVLVSLSAEPAVGSLAITGIVPTVTSA